MWFFFKSENEAYEEDGAEGLDGEEQTEDYGEEGTEDYGEDGEEDYDEEGTEDYGDETESVDGVPDVSFK